MSICISFVETIENFFFPEGERIGKPLEFAQQHFLTLIPHLETIFFFDSNARHDYAPCLQTTCVYLFYLPCYLNYFNLPYFVWQGSETFLSFVSKENSKSKIFWKPQKYTYGLVSWRFLEYFGQEFLKYLTNLKKINRNTLEIIEFRKQIIL